MGGDGGDGEVWDSLVVLLPELDWSHVGEYEECTGTDWVDGGTEYCSREGHEEDEGCVWVTLGEGHSVQREQSASLKGAQLVCACVRACVRLCVCVQQAKRVWNFA